MSAPFLNRRSRRRYFGLDALKLLEILPEARAQIARFTEKNPYSRFADGRPRVPDEVLDRIRELTSEEIWTTLTRLGYNNQFESGWQILHPEKLLVGRAVTAQYMPLRPDVGEVIEREAAAQGLAKGLPQRVIDTSSAARAHSSRMK